MCSDDVGNYLLRQTTPEEGKILSSYFVNQQNKTKTKPEQAFELKNLGHRRESFDGSHFSGNYYQKTMQAKKKTASNGQGIGG